MRYNLEIRYFYQSINIKNISLIYQSINIKNISLKSVYNIVGYPEHIVDYNDLVNVLNDYKYFIFRKEGLLFKVTILDK